jgi:hypothetical protein
LFSPSPICFFGVRRLDGAFPIDSTANESGVKPPHSKLSPRNSEYGLSAAPLFAGGRPRLPEDIP